MKKLLLFVFLGVFAGCSTAGPFITGISSDGRGGLNVQKGYVQYNYWTGIMDNKEGAQSHVQVVPEK